MDYLDIVNKAADSSMKKKKIQEVQNTDAYIESHWKERGCKFI